MKQKTIIFGMFISFLSVLLITSCGKEDYQPTAPQPTEVQKPIEEVQVQEESPVEEAEETAEQAPQAPEEPIDASAEIAIFGCEGFIDKLEACEPVSCEFPHPFTGELMERMIVGLEDGKCIYTEEMPNNGRMDCEYPESLRKAIAQYDRDIVAAESAGTEAKVESGEVKATYTIDGKEVENPLDEALESGACVVSGYG